MMTLSRSLFGLAGVALLGGDWMVSASHDALYPVSCTQDCQSSGAILMADLVKGKFDVTIDNVDASPLFKIVGPAEIQIHAGYSSTTEGSCSNGFAMFDGYESDYTKLCKEVEGNASGDFTRTAIVEVANVAAKASSGTLEGDQFSFSVSLNPGATWVEVGPEYIKLDASIHDQEFIWVAKDYGSIEGSEQTVLGVWGPAEVEFMNVDLRSDDFLNLRNGDWESERFHVSEPPTFKVYAPEGLNHIEYVAQASNVATDHSGFDVRIRPAQPLVEVVEQSPEQVEVVTIEDYEYPENGWDYRGCKVVRSTNYRLDESAKLQVNYDARIFSVASDLERDSRDSTCEDDYLLIAGNKFCNGVFVEPTEEQQNGSTKFFHAAEGDVIEYYSDSKDAADEGRLGWSFIICPTCELCGLEFSSPTAAPKPDPTTTATAAPKPDPTATATAAPKPDPTKPSFDPLLQLLRGDDDGLLTFEMSSDGFAETVYTDHFLHNMDVEIVALEDIDVEVVENDLEEGNDGSNKNTNEMAHCEDDYLIIGSNEPMCENHHRYEIRQAKKGETIKIHTDYDDNGRDEPDAPHKIKLVVRRSLFQMDRGLEQSEYGGVLTLHSDHYELVWGHYHHYYDWSIDMLEDCDVEVRENDLEKGDDGSNDNTNGMEHCEDDYLIIGSNGPMCENYHRYGKVIVKKGEWIIVHTDGDDNGRDDPHAPHRIDLLFMPRH